MNIDCKKWRELASDYIEGTLPAEMRDTLSAHLAGCARCRQDEVALRSIARELNVLPETDPPLFFRENVMAAIERQGVRSASNPWQWLLDNYRRPTVSGPLTAAFAVVIGLAVWLPRGGGSSDVRQAAGITAPELAPSPEPIRRAPELKITRITTVLPGEGAAWDFSFHLANAESGSVRFKVGSVDQEYPFRMNGALPQTLRISPAVLADKKLLELRANWTADGVMHTRTLFLPVVNEGQPMPDARQSFGLPEATLVDSAREIALRYGQPIILDDVAQDQVVRLTAKDESAEDTLRRQMTPMGLTVEMTSDGLVVESSGGRTADKP
ncbi:MAG: zf-HC2 domain-containing protein [Capsulimonadales bacterium]|nr:zf-HC2 domain-containing protein [Capsulimonadales bacterium]